MSVQIYQPSIINSLVSICYSPKSTLMNNTHLHTLLKIRCSPNGKIPLIPGAHISDLVYIVFNPDFKIWELYHRKLENLMVFAKFNEIYPILNTMNKYYAVVLNQNLKLIQCTTSDGKVFIYDWCYDHEPNANILDSIIPTLGGGIVHINPTSHIDLIFCIVKFSRGRDHTSEMMEILVSDEYYDHTSFAFENFRKNFEKIRDIDPMPAYKEIYKCFQKNDSEYFSRKIVEFQEQILEFFSEMNNAFRLRGSALADFMTSFIDKFKKDVVIEIYTLYNRFRNYVSERNVIYQLDHPYVELLKMMDDFNIGTESDVSNMIFFNDSFVVYDKLTSAILSAIKNRHGLLYLVYQEYWSTVTSGPKAKNWATTKHNYYPFKIFSPSLFLMEHLLNQ